MKSLGLSLIVCSMVVALCVASGIAANATVVVRPGVPGSFRYPVNASKYPDNAKSNWLFQTIPGYVVHLTFTDIDTEGSISGCSDFIEVFDSISGTNLVDKVCGKKTNRQYYSTGQCMYVTFSSDISFARTGFNLTYEAVLLVTVYPDTNCSSIRLVAALGTEHFLKYPALHTNYSTNRSCSWLITTGNITGVVHVTLLSVDIELSAYCQRDYLELFDGELNFYPSRRLGKFCGRQTQIELHSNGQSLLVTFYSDFAVSGSGFHLSYEAVRQSEALPATGVNQTSQNVCTPNVRLSAVYHLPRELKYPITPANLLGFTECRWILQTSNTDYVVHANFTYVDIGSSSNCVDHFVEVFDGFPESQSLGKLCHQTTQRDFYSSGQSMLVVFHSYIIFSPRGFHMSYEAVGSTEKPQDIDSVCPSESRTRTVTLTPQYLKYPHSAVLYPNNAVCVWILQTTDYDYIVHVTFTSVDIEDSYDCLYDYVELHDGSSQLSSRLGRICGDRSRDFYSSGQYMYIRFISDSSGRRSGFRLTYEAFSRRNVPTTTVHSPYSPADIDLGFSKIANRPSVIVGSVIGVIFLILTVLAIFIVARQRRGAQLSRTHSPAVSRHPQSTAPSCTPSPPAPSTFPPSVFDAPPAYDAVCPPEDSSNPAGGIPSPLTSGPPPAYSTLGFPLQASTNPARSPPPDVTRQTSAAQGKDGHINLSFSMEQGGSVYYSGASDVSSVPDRPR